MIAYGKKIIKENLMNYFKSKEGYAKEKIGIDYYFAYRTDSREYGFSVKGCLILTDYFVIELNSVTSSYICDYFKRKIMKKKLILFILLTIVQYTAAQKMKYGIFAFSKGVVETGEILEPARQFFIEAILDGNELIWGKEKIFSLYNKTERNNGFNSIISYEAVDNKNQRCYIYFMRDDTQQSSFKDIILITYENDKVGYYFNSREPEILNK